MNSTSSTTHKKEMSKIYDTPSLPFSFMYSAKQHMSPKDFKRVSSRLRSQKFQHAVCSLASKTLLYSGALTAVFHATGPLYAPTMAKGIFAGALMGAAALLGKHTADLTIGIGWNDTRQKLKDCADEIIRAVPDEEKQALRDLRPRIEFQGPHII